MNAGQLDEALQVLRRCKPIFADRFGVTELGVFGSVVRGEATPESDMDIVVRMRTPRLFFMAHIKDELERAFQRRVDIVHYRDKMNEFLKKRIDSGAIYV